MTDIPIIDIVIPKTCKECFSGPFKLPMPLCRYETALEVKRAVNHFKNKHKFILPLDMDSALMELRKSTERCLLGCPKRAEALRQRMQAEAFQSQITALMNVVEKMQTENKKLHADPIDNPIFKQEHDLDSPIQEVKNPDIPDSNVDDLKPENGLKMTFERSPMQKKSKDKTKYKIVSGWLKYQRNIKSSNVKKYLEKMKIDHPELASEIEKVKAGKKSEIVRIETNAKKNKMIGFRKIK